MSVSADASPVSFASGAPGHLASLIARDVAGPEQASMTDHTGLEVDAIVDVGPGRWAAFEIKLGLSRIDDAVRSLLKFAERRRV